MEYRNARYSDILSVSSVDCEINHPIYGWIETTVPLDDSDPDTQSLRDLLLSENTTEALSKKLVNGALVPVTQADKDAKFADDLIKETEAINRATKAEAKLAGVEFEGVMCSATKEDMWGLSSVQAWIRAGQSTDFNFDNGNTLTLTPQNIDAFEAVWVPFRASFF